MPAKKKAAKKRAAKKRAAKKRAKKKGAGTFYSRAVKRTPATRSAGQSRRKAPRKSATDTDTFEAGLVFVAVSFREKGMDDAFSAIKDTCKSLRLRARRVDENTSSGFIILEIIDLIERAEFIIFDLTHERPNVYYELGYAHGVGNSPSNILLLARDGTDLHFDIAGLRVHFYESTESLRRIIGNSLRQMMKATRQ